MDLILISHRTEKKVMCDVDNAQTNVDKIQKYKEE